MSLKIGFLIQQMKNDPSASIILETMNILRGKKVKIDIVNPDEYLMDLSFLEVACDLYILRPWPVELSLSLGSILHHKGAKILNSFPASSEVKDKIRVTSRLFERGIPTPQSFVTGSLGLITAREEYPFILKPHRGSCSEGITILRANEPLSAELDGTFILQEFLNSDGEDLKIYVIGNEVYGLKRSPQAKTYQEKAGRPYPLNENLKQIALDCGEIFDLHIYGIDIIETDQGPFVVDINAFPGFIGVPDASEKLADYIYRYATTGPEIFPLVLQTGLNPQTVFRA